MSECKLKGPNYEVGDCDTVCTTHGRLASKIHNLPCHKGGEKLSNYICPVSLAKLMGAAAECNDDNATCPVEEPHFHKTGGLTYDGEPLYAAYDGVKYYKRGTKTISFRER